MIKVNTSAKRKMGIARSSEAKRSLTAKVSGAGGGEIEDVT